MTQSFNLVDQYNNPLRILPAIGGSTLTDERGSSQNFGAINAESVIDIALERAVAIDVRGTFTGTLEAQISIDGTNYLTLPIFNLATEIFVPTISVVGFFAVDLPAGTKKFRLRATALSVGTAIVSMRAVPGSEVQYQKSLPIVAVTILGAANAIATATLPAPGAGLFHYIVGIEVKRINNSAVAVAGTALLTTTTTNLPGTLAFSNGNALAVGEDKTDVSRDFQNPLKSSVANTATTIVAPASGAGVQTRITVYYYIGA